jgi:hypothetical protein
VNSAKMARSFAAKRSLPTAVGLLYLAGVLNVSSISDHIGPVFSDAVYIKLSGKQNKKQNRLKTLKTAKPTVNSAKGFAVDSAKPTIEGAEVDERQMSASGKRRMTASENRVPVEIAGKTILVGVSNWNYLRVPVEIAGKTIMVGVRRNYLRVPVEIAGKTIMVGVSNWNYFSVKEYEYYSVLDF